MIDLNLTDDFFKIIPETYEPKGSSFYNWEWKKSLKKEERFQKRIKRVCGNKRIPEGREMDEMMRALRGKFINPEDLIYIYNYEWSLERDLQGEFINDPDDNQHRVRHIAKVVSEYGLKVQKLTREEMEWWSEWLMTHKLSDIPCDLKMYQVTRAWKLRYDLPRDPLFSGVTRMLVDFAGLGVLMHRLANPKWSVQLYKWPLRCRLSILVRAIPELAISWITNLFVIPLMLMTLAVRGLTGVLRCMDWGPIRIIMDILSVISGIVILMLIVDTVVRKKDKAAKLESDMWAKFNDNARKRMMDANMPYPNVWKNKIM